VVEVAGVPVAFLAGSVGEPARRSHKSSPALPNRAPGPYMLVCLAWTQPSTHSNPHLPLDHHTRTPPCLWAVNTRRTDAPPTCVLDVDGGWGRWAGVTWSINFARQVRRDATEFVRHRASHPRPRSGPAGPRPRPSGSNGPSACATPVRVSVVRSNRRRDVHELILGASIVVRWGECRAGCRVASHICAQQQCRLPLTRLALQAERRLPGTCIRDIRHLYWVWRRAYRSMRGGGERAYARGCGPGVHGVSKFVRCGFALVLGPPSGANCARGRRSRSLRKKIAKRRGVLVRSGENSSVAWGACE